MLRNFYLVTTSRSNCKWLTWRRREWKYSVDLDVKIVLSLNDVLTIHWYLLLLSLTRYIVCTCVLFSSFNHFLAKTVEIRCIFYRVTKRHVEMFCKSHPLNLQDIHLSTGKLAFYSIYVKWAVVSLSILSLVNRRRTHFIAFYIFLLTT